MKSERKTSELFRYGARDTPSRFHSTQNCADLVANINRSLIRIWRRVFMKRRIVGLFALVMLIPALSFPLTVPAAPPADLHPELRDAITALRRANQRLQRVGGDWGGHKADTLKATNEAIVQLQLCLPYDNGNQ
jgi:hypothetical protein